MHVIMVLLFLLWNENTRRNGKNKKNISDLCRAFSPFWTSFIPVRARFIPVRARFISMRACFFPSTEWLNPRAYWLNPLVDRIYPRADWLHPHAVTQTKPVRTAKFFLLLFFFFFLFTCFLNCLLTAEKECNSIRIRVAALMERNKRFSWNMT